MKNTDSFMMILTQISIFMFVFIATFKDLKIKGKRQLSEVKDEVIRGDKSMSALYTVYGATIASCLVLIDKALGLEGHKVILIVFDFLCVTYIFFFSSWFRNSLFFPLMAKIRKD